MNKTKLKSFKSQKRLWIGITILVFSLFFSNCNTVNAQFTEVFAGDLPAVQYGTVDWGDYDMDGDLDVLITGFANTEKIARIYENNGGGFTEAYPGSLTGVWAGTADWGDFDNDGDLDLVLTGHTGSAYVAKLYQNTGSGFVEVYEGSLTPVRYSSTDWGDFDNDGDLDLILTGHTGPELITKIYENIGDGFVEAYPGNIIGIAYGSVSWGDCDNDGVLDILLTGYSNEAIGRIYKNTGTGFVEVYAGQITGAYWGASELGDYDNDGDLDIVLSGRDNLSNIISKIYNNTGSGFVEVFAGSLIGVHSWECQNNISWGDYDNDGDLDILVTGRNVADVKFSRIYRNNGSSFSEVFAGSLTPVAMSTVAWGDYNNDKKLDILLTGNSAGGILITKLYLNECPVANTKPTTPENCNIVASGTDVTLSWDKATDSETLQDGLSYNIYVVSADAEGFIRSPQSDTTSDEDNGYRYVSSVGSIQYCESGYTLKNLAEGTYNWGVQAVDAGFLGGSFQVVPTIFIGTELNLYGNDFPILSGDDSPSVDDNTDFGEVPTGETQTHLFSIFNAGSYDLILTGEPRITVEGVGFELVQDAPALITPGTTAEFSISFTPQTCSLHTALVSFVNNDPDEADYSFTVSGIGIDNQPPDFPDLPILTGECSVTASVPETNDNCAGTLVGQTSDPLSYSELGSHIINWSFDDNNGNIIIVPQTIIVEDNTYPEIICPQDEVYYLTSEEISYIISGQELDPVSITDNCEIFSLSNDFNDLASLDGAEISVGTTTITWTVTDIGGNQTNCSNNIIVEDYVFVQDLANDFKILYPNPASDKVFLNFSVPVIIQVSDIYGQTIYENIPVNPNGFVDVSMLKSGVYILTVQSPQISKSFKIIKE
jgi:hypothetical protein